MGFLDSEIPIDIRSTLNVTISFINKIVQDGSGAQVVQLPWSSPLRQFRLSNPFINYSDHQNFQAFVRVLNGRLHKFKFKDYFDYQLTKEPVQHLVADCYSKGTLLESATNTYQVCKEYGFVGGIHYRPITRIDEATIVIYDGDTDIGSANWTFEQATGKLTTTVSVADPKISGEFYTPVRLGNDSITKEVASIWDEGAGVTRAVINLSDLILEEVREKPDFWPVDTFISDLSAHNLIVDFNNGMNVSDDEQVLLLGNDSGFESRIARKTRHFREWRLGTNNLLYNNDLAYLIAMWLVIKGGGSRIGFIDHLEDSVIRCVRFQGGDLTYRQTNQGEKGIHSVGGLIIKESLEAVAAPIPPEGFPDDDYEIFFAEDYGQINTPPTPSSNVTNPVNCDATDANWTAKAEPPTAGIEDFEGQSPQATDDLAIAFAGTAITGNITVVTGGQSLVVENTPGLGRYNTTPGGSQYLKIGAETTITLSAHVAAIAFRMTDVKDFAGDLSIKLFSGMTELIEIAVPVAGQSNSDDNPIWSGLPPGTPIPFNWTHNGNQLFWAVGTADANKYFDRVVVVDPASPGSQGFNDSFGWDDIRIKTV